jgi:hypothetical protein
VTDEDLGRALAPGCRPEDQLAIVQMLKADARETYENLISTADALGCGTILPGVIVCKRGKQ